MADVSITVPDGVNPEALAMFLDRAAKEAAALSERQTQSLALWRNACDSAEGLAELEKGFDVPLGRHCYYAGRDGEEHRHDITHAMRRGQYSEIGINQEWDKIQSDPRRPAVLRGGKDVMIERYSWTAPHIANGFVTSLVYRYLRRIKYTCLDEETHRKNIDTIRDWCREKKLWTSSHMDWICIGEEYGSHRFGVGKREYDWGDKTYVWINGRRSGLTDHQLQYVKSLYAKIGKLERLEKQWPVSSTPTRN